MPNSDDALAQMKPGAYETLRALKEASESGVVQRKELIGDATQNTLEDALDKFGRTALRIKGQRDQAVVVLDTIIANIQQWNKTLVVTEGNEEAGAWATNMNHLLDYVRDQRDRLT